MSCYIVPQYIGAQRYFKPWSACHVYMQDPNVIIVVPANALEPSIGFSVY